MVSFLEQENSHLEQLKKRYPNQAYKFNSFLKSEYISKDIKLYLGLLNVTTNNINSEELFNNIAFFAVNKFINRYLNAVYNLLLEIDSDIIGVKDLEYKDFKQLDLNYLDQIFEKEPFFKWLFTKGMKILNEVNRKIEVKNIVELSNLIRTLEYLESFLSEDSGRNISILYDIPEKLKNEVNIH